MSEKPDLFIFVHVPKTAGTTFVKHLQKNFLPRQLFSVYPQDFDLSESADRKVYARAIKKRVLGMTKAERSGVRVIFGHCVPWGIEKFFGRHAHYVIFLRDPVARAVSVYNYLRTLYERGIEDEKARARVSHLLFVENSVPEFPEWFEKKYLPRSADFGLMTQADYLRKFGCFLGSDYQSALNKFDFVGIVENFENDSLYVYSRLGVRRLFPNQNESRKYYTPGRLLKAKMKFKLRDDYKLYLAARGANRRFRQESEGYARGVYDMRKKRRFIVYNRLRYDFFNTLREFKQKIVK